MRRCDMRVTEEMLYSFPDVCLDLKTKRFILEASAGPHESGPVQGGEDIPEQIVIIERKDADARYRLLAAAAERVFDTYAAAPPRLRELIKLVFFLRCDHEYAASELGLNRSSFFRMKSKAIRHMCDVCVQMHPVFKSWRDERDEDRIEAIYARTSFGGA